MPATTIDHLITAELGKIEGNSSERVVLKAFETLSASISDYYDEREDSATDKDAFAATEILLYAVSTKSLPWDRLKTIAIKKIRYDMAFSIFSGMLHLEIEGEFHSYKNREGYIKYLNNTSKPLEYIEYIDAYIFSLEKSKKNKYISIPSDRLKKKSASYWKNYHFHASASFTNEPFVASRYEKTLLKIPLFTNELRKMINDADNNLQSFTRAWGYFYNEDMLLTHDETFGSLHLPHENEPWSTLNKRLKEFCLKWCIESVSSGYNAPKLDHINFKAMRVRVKPRDDNAGLDVFIPRIYKFSHLQNYENQDFEHLKRGMNEIYDSFTVPRDKGRSLKETIQLAKDLRRQLRKEGLSRHDAWAETVERLKWTPNQMEAYLGPQPKPDSYFKSYRKKNKTISDGDSPDAHSIPTR